MRVVDKEVFEHQVWCSGLLHIPQSCLLGVRTLVQNGNCILLECFSRVKKGGLGQHWKETMKISWTP